MSSRLRPLFLAFLLQQASQAEVSLFPAPENLPELSQFSVEVNTLDGWQPTFVYFNKARTDGLGAQDEPGRTTSWTTFQCDEPTRLRVTRKSGTFSKAIIRPKRFQIIPVKAGNEANPLSPPCIPPKFVLHGLSSKSKFLAVNSTWLLVRM